ncbi:MAG: phosphonate ABC transporter, permease protein PhnE [Acidobacteria bacterium]|nr:phosphonate ABC transporter, permease protein PhnE [Acidobacteriota bacterium]
MTIADDPIVTERPTEPPRSVKYVGLVVVAVVLSIPFGALDINSAARGAVYGLIAYGLLALLGATARPNVRSGLVDLLSLITAGAVGLKLYIAPIAARTTVITWRLSMRASLGWLLFGIVVGWVVFHNRKGTNPSAIVFIGLAFAAAAFLALQAGTDVGYLEPITDRAIKRGEFQIIEQVFHVWVGLITLGVGLAVATSFVLGNAVVIAVTGAAVFTMLAFNKIDFSVFELIIRSSEVTALAEKLWPPDFTWSKSIGQPETFVLWAPYVETLRIAVVGATTGVLVAVPLAFSASRLTTPNQTVYWIAKSIMNVIRTIPDLFWGILFAAAVGFGSPFPGALAMIMFSIAIMAKLLSETVDAIDPGPLEAARSTGASHWQMVKSAAFPQVVPHYVAYGLYVLELNVRASVILGFIGAGGIGRLLDERRNFFQWDQVMAIVLVIFVTVILIEIVSIAVRRRII